MSILSVIQLTMKDAEAEKKFLAAFTKGLEHIDKVKGLISISAWKQIGTDFTYMAYTLWESEEAIEKWRNSDTEKKLIEMGKKDLLKSFKIQRFTPSGKEKTGNK